ncbi:hypothetical protein QYF36_005438 [Acer negundo]|nr:hypothetical protein QYF36_005438 [Acer negundo]
MSALRPNQGCNPDLTDATTPVLAIAHVSLYQSSSTNPRTPAPSPTPTTHDSENSAPFPTPILMSRNL